MKDAPMAKSDRPVLTFLIVTASLGCTLAISMPGGIFLANSADFTISTSEFLMFAVPIFLVGLGIASAIYFSLPRVLQHYFISVLFALALLAWFQGNVLIWDYGPLDGRAISWDDYRLHGIIDSAIWATVLVLSVVGLRSVLKVAFTISAFMILVSLGMTAMVMLQQSEDLEAPSIKNFQIDESSKFVYSDDRNVILIVLDAFQADVFSDVIDDQEYARVFDGFTYFPNAVAASNFTQVSIPALLTGKLYDNSVPKSEYMRKSFLEYGITTLLVRAGYSVGVYPWVGWGNETIYFDESVATNLTLEANTDSKKKIYSEQNAKEMLHLIDLSLFRIVPNFLKRYIYNDQRWFTIQIATAMIPTSVKQTISTDNQYEANVFVSEALEMARYGTSDATFKYYHLKGAHRPLSVAPDLSFSNSNFPFNRENYVFSVKANIIAIGEFLDKLRSENLFANSLIIIVGDHGSGNSPDVYIEPGETGERILGTTRNFQKDKARGVPVVLIKRFEASGVISTNNAPVALSDIPATIISEIGIDGPAVGRSVFGILPTESRTRTYAAFDYSATHSDFVAPLTIYEVSGDSWRDSSWSVKTIRHPQNSE